MDSVKLLNDLPPFAQGVFRGEGQLEGFVIDPFGTEPGPHLLQVFKHLPAIQSGCLPACGRSAAQGLGQPYCAVDHESLGGVQQAARVDEAGVLAFILQALPMFLYFRGTELLTDARGRTHHMVLKAMVAVVSDGKGSGC